MSCPRVKRSFKIRKGEVCVCRAILLLLNKNSSQHLCVGMVVAQKLNCISWLRSLSVGTPWSHFSQDLGPWGHQNVILIPTPHPAHHQARGQRGEGSRDGSAPSSLSRGRGRTWVWEMRGQVLGSSTSWVSLMQALPRNTRPADAFRRG